MTAPASNPNEPKPKWKFAAFIILFLVPVLLLAFAIWAAGALPAVFGGRYAYRPSPDRDGNVVAELKYANGPNQTDIKKWTLAIPHKYVDKIIGDLDNIGNDELASLTLNGLLEISSQKTFFLQQQSGIAGTVYILMFIITGHLMFLSPERLV
jgi:hypothetical protein